MITEDISYARRADEMDREYLAAWEQLPEVTRARLTAAGVAGPELNDHRSEQGAKDVSDYVELTEPEPPALKTEPELVAALLSMTREDELADAFAEHFNIPPATTKRLVSWIMDGIERELQRRLAEKLGHVVGLLLVEHNVKVSVMGLAFALNFPELQNMGCGTMRAAAKVIGCSASYLSQHANRWCDVLELPRPKTMKSQDARESYSEERLSNHWRKQVCQSPPR